ncbi:MAG TPA: hypothetical protein VIY08_04420 [Candidatus Nitrosocosmicus sp.]
MTSCKNDALGEFKRLVAVTIGGGRKTSGYGQGYCFIHLYHLIQLCNGKSPYT